MNRRLLTGLHRTFSRRWKTVPGISFILVGFFIIGGMAASPNIQSYSSQVSSYSPFEDPFLDMAYRSPGSRVGDTLQKKPYHQMASSPAERVLSGVRETPVDFDQPPFAPFDSFGPPPLFSTPVIPERTAFFAGSPPLPVGSGGIDYPATVSESIPAVPELSTWAMMIIGFFVTGAAVRRRRHGPRGDRIRPSKRHGCA